MTAPEPEGLRERILLALASADGQPWKSIAEATRHTAEFMYGKQADAMEQIIADHKASFAASEADRATAGERECETCGHIEDLHIAGPCLACSRGRRNRSHVAESGDHKDCQRFVHATPPADDASECEDGVFGSQDIANALGGIGPVCTPDATASEPLSGEAYYVEHGWSGCDGSRWDRLPSATQDGWRAAAHEAAAATRARAEGAAAERERIATAIEALTGPMTGENSINDYLALCARIARGKS